MLLRIRQVHLLDRVAQREITLFPSLYSQTLVPQALEIMLRISR